MYALDRKKLKFYDTCCDLCGGNRTSHQNSKYFFEMEFRFVRCLACGLIYQNPMLDKESRSHIYETIEYWNHKESGLNNSPMLNYYSYFSNKQQRSRTNNIRVKLIRSRLREKSRILDLGCADGFFVKALSDEGFDAVGMDISHSMGIRGEICNNVNWVQADCEKEWPLSEPFDAITCYAALSNFSSVSRVFEQIQLHLKPGGYFFFNFCDSQRLVSRAFGNRLYNYRPTAGLIYSSQVIQKYCKKFNLKILELKNDVQIVPISRLCGFLKIPLLLEMLKLMRLQNKSMKMILPTGYMACAVKIG